MNRTPPGFCHMLSDSTQYDVRPKEPPLETGHGRTSDRPTRPGVRVRARQGPFLAFRRSHRHHREIDVQGHSGYFGRC